MSLIYRKKNNSLFFSEMALLLFSTIFYFNYNNLIAYRLTAIIVAYLLIIIVIIISIIINGIDFITFMLICSELILIPLSIQYFSGTSYGLLELDLYPLYLPEILTVIYLYSTTMVFLSGLFNFSMKEKRLIQNGGLNLGNAAIIFNNIIAIVFVIVAFPRFGMATDGVERFNMLLPGHSWNQLSVVALLFNLRYLKSHISVKLTYLFVITWFLMDGERADVSGIIFGIFILYFQKRGKNQRKLNVLLLFLALIIFVDLLNLIVVIRNGKPITLRNVIGGLFTTATLSDVGYLCNVSVDYWTKFGNLKGILLKSNILSAIPFFDPYDFTKFIDSVHYPNPGGESLFSEPLLDYGFVGLPFISTLDFFIYRIIIQFNNKFFFYEYLVILCSIPRIVWYGRSYFYSSALFFVPIMFILNIFISRNFKLSYKE